jgi:peptidoglycan/xylan/chitin deacetylase (PgdA/CDA1 family)
MPTSAKVVALTFDAGANGDGVTSILATLQAKGAVGTFFLTGAFTRQFPDLATAIATAGERIGNHSVDHPHLPTLSDSQVGEEVLGASASIRAATGQDPAPFFRFPYGDSDSRTLADLNGLGYVAIGWTVDTLGWEGTSGGITSAEVLSRAVGALQPGEIVLMHVGSNPTDGSTLDAQTLPAMIDAMRQAGYSFVTLDALLG